MRSRDRKCPFQHPLGVVRTPKGHLNLPWRNDSESQRYGIPVTPSPARAASASPCSVSGTSWEFHPAPFPFPVLFSQDQNRGYPPEWRLGGISFPVGQNPLQVRTS